MKVVILTSKYSLFSATIINALLKNKELELELVISNELNNMIKETAETIRMSGFIYFTSKVILMLKTQIRSRLREINEYFIKDRDVFYSLSELSGIYKNLRIHGINDINSHAFYDKLCSIGPEMVLSIGFDKILKKDILSYKCKYGFINIHPSLLPSYAGCMPNFWVLFNNEVETGVTIHTMDKLVDSGDIILQEKIAVDAADNLTSLKIKTAEVSIKLLERLMNDTDIYTKNGAKMDNRSRTYFSKPTKNKINKNVKRLIKVIF